MDQQREHDTFQRIQLNEKLGRVQGIIVQHQQHEAFYQRLAGHYRYLLGA